MGIGMGDRGGRPLVLLSSSDWCLIRGGKGVRVKGGGFGCWVLGYRVSDPSEAYFESCRRCNIHGRRKRSDENLSWHVKIGLG